MNNSRRKFLQHGITICATAVVSTSLISCGKKNKVVDSKEKTILLTHEGEIVEVDKSQLHSCSHHGASSKASRKGIPGRKFVMVIDLAKCKNARKCVTKCQEMHHLPKDQEFIKVLLMQESDKTSPYWMPKPCFHCDKPPCVSLCPVGATFKRTDGCVLVDNSKCIGCKFCMTGCPYSARIFNWGHINHSSEEMEHKYSPETGLPRVHGTVTKCDFCPDMAREGKLPDCITACPNGVIYYGDENEDVVTNGSDIVRFSELIRDKGGYRYADDLGTEPSVYYLPPVDRMFSVQSGLNDISEEVKKRYGEMLSNI